MPDPPFRISVEDLIRQEAEAQGVPPALALAIAEQESSLDPTALGPPVPSMGGARALGTFQVMPSTGAMRRFDPTDPVQNIRGGVGYLRQLLDQHQGDLDAVLRTYGGVEKNTTYVPGVLARIPKFETGGVTTPSASARPHRPGDIRVPTAAEVAARTRTQPPPQPGGPPAPPGSPAWEAAKSFAGEATQTLRAIPAAAGAVNRAVQQAFWHPVETAQAVNAAIQQGFWHPLQTLGAIAGREGQKAREAFEQGDYLRAALEAKNVPLNLVGIGGRLSEAEEYMRRGEVARGLGATADVALAAMAPEALRSGVRVAPALVKSRLPAAKAAAVEFGRRAGIPIDLATTTRNRFIKRFQSGMESTPLGGIVRARVEAERGKVLPELAERLKQPAGAAMVTPEEAGVSLATRLEQNIARAHGEANTAYDTFRQVEALPANTRTVQTGTKTVTSPILGPQGQPITQVVPIFEDIQLPVDLRVAKRQLRPLVDRLHRQLPITQQQASPGLKALENLVSGPDYAPASQVEADLSVIKSLARGAELPELRNVSQGLAAKGVATLQAQVDRTVARAGPNATKALEAGRAATRRKFATKEVFDKLREEPVQAFRQATAGGDVNIEYLRQLAQEAPRETRQIGRAVLDHLVEQATQRGGYERAAHVANQWERLGPETKRLLYDPRHVEDLDNFFLLTRMLAEHPNPSATALTLTSIASGGWFYFHGSTGLPALLAAGTLAGLMNSPRGVRLLTQGLTIRSNTAAAAAWGAQMAGLIQRERERRAQSPAPSQPRGSQPSSSPPPAPPR
jgi:Transglycosylase SLT domain